MRVRVNAFPLRGAGSRGGTVGACDNSTDRADRRDRGTALAVDEVFINIFAPIHLIRQLR